MSSTHDENGVRVVKFDGALHVSGVMALKTRILDALESCRAIVLDLAEVEDCDTASLQLVVAACHSKFPDGRAIRLGRFSTAVKTTAEKLGLRLSACAEPNPE